MPFTMIELGHGYNAVSAPPQWATEVSEFIDMLPPPEEGKGTLRIFTCQKPL